MKGLKQFQHFDVAGFLQPLGLRSKDCGAWKDENNNVLGTRITAVIVRDDANLTDNKGIPINRVFDTFSIKIPNISLTIPPNAPIRVINPQTAVGSVWGTYQNNLTVTCDGIEQAQPQQSKRP